MRNGRGKIYGYERQLSTRVQTAAFYLALAILTPYTSVVDPDLDPGWVKKSKPGSGMNIPDHISKSLETIFLIKILKFFDADPDPGS
jgi:hypothetical protein